MITKIKQRAKSETPHFFKKLRNWAIVAGALAAFLITIPVTWPAWVASGLSLIVAVSTTVAGTSQLTTTDNELSKK